MTSRIIIVANRLPVSASHKDGKLCFQRSNGGLVSGLSGIKWREILWVGWPGDVEESDREDAARQLDEMKFRPVFMDSTLSSLFYEGYCNGALWPLFHSMPMYSKTIDAEYEAFIEATHLFCKQVVAIYRPGDVVWVHDYHLLMLPQELRKELGSKAAMTFFLHIPFPHVDVFRLLPNHRRILESVLQVDQIGFHTSEYVSNFIGCINRLHGITPVMNRALVPALRVGEGDAAVKLPAHAIQIGAYPMGIDFEHFAGDATAERVRQRAAGIRVHLGAEKVVLSVSRLDYTKGVPPSLDAFRGFLRECPQWVGRAVFVLVVVPSRTGVERYAELKDEIDRLVGQINGEFGTPVWTPVVYMYRGFGHEDLLALYLAADVALVIPFRDGMNLCAKEYVAARSAVSGGVLILSTLAGAAKELIESVIVNPNSQDNVVRGLQQAFSMPADEQTSRIARMASLLEERDISHWHEEIFRQLDDVLAAKARLEVSQLDDRAHASMLSQIAVAARRLLVLDYDGTLVPFADDPAKASPDAELLALLGDLSRSPRNTVLVLSGRDRVTLGTWLSCVPGIELAAEHGAWSWSPDTAEWARCPRVSLDMRWKAGVRELMEGTERLLPGSFVEEKEFSLVFHFRACRNSGVLERKKIDDAVLSLKSTLISSVSGLPVRVCDAKEAIEVKAHGASKGEFYLAFAEKMQQPAGFTLAMGDDATDEDVFEVLPPSAFSVRVGLCPSHARYNVASYLEARDLLRAIVEADSEASSNGIVAPCGVSV